MIVLPTVKSSPKSKNPKFLIYFGKPKSGKTTIASMLDNNLIIDLENGSEFLSALSIQARTVNDLAEIAEAIKTKNKEINGYAYKYITIDNGTKLEDVALSYAAKLYKATPMGKSWDGTDVRELPNGSGYYYLKKAFQKKLEEIRALAVPDQGFCAYVINGGNGKQVMGGWTYVPHGKAKLKKSSKEPQVTEQNPAYRSGLRSLY